MACAIHFAQVCPADDMDANAIKADLCYSLFPREEGKHATPQRATGAQCVVRRRNRSEGRPRPEPLFKHWDWLV